MSDQPIRPEHRAMMNAIAERLDACFPGFGFALLVFDLGANPGTGFMNYISNAKREDMCEAMLEFVKRSEQAKQ